MCVESSASNLLQKWQRKGKILEDFHSWMAMGAEYHVAYWVYFGRCLIYKNYLLIRK